MTTGCQNHFLAFFREGPLKEDNGNCVTSSIKITIPTINETFFSCLTESFRTSLLYSIIKLNFVISLQYIVTYVNSFEDNYPFVDNLNAFRHALNTCFHILFHSSLYIQ